METKKRLLVKRNSKESTDFIIWATKTLKEYIKKGFVVNSELLKNGRQKIKTSNSMEAPTLLAF
ncbi:MAG: virulence RhuM family protein [Clostridia bacterium]|nr:virulence RhuM family protein [Clostridia bacterium]